MDSLASTFLALHRAGLEYTVAAMSDADLELSLLSCREALGTDHLTPRELADLTAIGDEMEGEIRARLEPAVYGEWARGVLRAYVAAFGGTPGEAIETLRAHRPRLMGLFAAEHTPESAVQAFGARAAA